MPLAFEPMHSVGPNFSDGETDSATKFAKSKRLSLRLKRLSDDFRRSRFDPNVSILTQCSHVTNRPHINKGQVNRHLNASTASVKSTSTCHAPINESSEEAWEDTVSDGDMDSDVHTKRGLTFSHHKSEAESSIQTPESSRKVIRKSKPPKLKSFPREEKSKPMVELYDWIIRPLPDLQGVCVEGQKKGMADFWHSSAITEVKKQKYVKTASGTVYRLRGKINKLCTIENGFSKSVANHFADGFPADWKKILEKFYSSLEQSVSVYDECSLVPKLKKFGGKKPTHARPTKEKEENTHLDSILTPVGLVKRCNTVDSFTVTRSGRLSLPPLARWQGQQYIFKSSTNTLHVGFHTSGAEEALLEETKDFMKVHKRFQKPMHHKSLSNSVIGSPNNYSSLTRRDSPNTVTGSTSVRGGILGEKTSVSGKNGKEHQRKTKRAGAKTNEAKKNEKKITTSKKNGKEDSFLRDTSLIDKSFESIPVISLVDCCKDKRYSRSAHKNREVGKVSTECAKVESKSNSYVKKKSGVEMNKTLDTSATVDDILNSSMVLRSKKKLPKQCEENFYLNRIQDSGFKADSKKRSACQKSQSSNTRSLKNNKSQKEPAKQVNGDDIGKDRRGMKRKHNSSSGEDTGYGTEEQSVVSTQQDSTPKSCKSQERKRRRLSLHTDSGDNETWTSKEKNLFERAMRTVDCDSSDFWYEVSDIVGSKTGGECREFHTIYLDENTKKKGANSNGERKKITRKSSGRQKGDPIRGGKGTLKRKEDMRELLKEQNDEYEDNLFEGTPFVSRKQPVPMISNIDFDKDDSAIFGTNHNFITPMTKNISIRTPCTRVRAQLASTKKTPVIQTNHNVSDTPVSVTRHIADKYIHTLMNQRKTNSYDNAATVSGAGGGGSSVPENEVTKKKTIATDKLPLKALFSPSIVVYDKERRLEEEEEEEEEENNPYIYYWNEDES